MLDITHMETGVLPFHEEVFDLAALVAEVVEEVQLTTERHQIRSEGEGPIQTSADRERTGQVLINLLTNAIKYTPQGGEVRVRCEAKGETVTLSVQDHGIGIPQEHQAHVFERFYRAPSTKHQSFPGLGLGLYLSAEIVARQGGEIWVKSWEGEGSTFFFTLKRERHP
jgi:signal transduction histidine kinase